MLAAGVLVSDPWSVVVVTVARAGVGQGKRSVLGVLVDVTDYRDATERIMQAARERRGFAVTALAVHGVMTGVEDRAHNARLNSFDLVTPDGQPVRWALNVVHHAGLTDRVYGPTLTLKVVERAAAEGLPIYLYGSTEPTLARLAPALVRVVPRLENPRGAARKFTASENGEPVEI